MRLRLDREPDTSAALFVAPDAVVVGEVTLGPRSSVFYTAVLRADLERIDVGAGTNIQDGVVVHADPGYPVRVGAGVTVGHRAVLHGATIGDGALIGMGAVLLNGCTIGEEAIVAAGAVVTEGTEIPARTLAVGSPARVKRPLTTEEVAGLGENAAIYLTLARAHRAACADDPGKAQRSDRDHDGS